MKTQFNILLSIILVFSLWSCEEPDTTAPIVVITNPVENAEYSGGFVVIMVEATDDTEISKVELHIDGSLHSTITNSPWEFHWNTEAYADGQHHSLLAKAYDAAGNVGVSSLISVRVYSSDVSISTDVVNIEEGTTITSVDANDIILSFSGTAPDVNTGDVIVGAAQGGYLRSVTNVQTSGSQMSIQTDQASIVDAIKRGIIDTTISVTYSGLNKQGALFGMQADFMREGVTMTPTGINISGTVLLDENVSGTNIRINIPTGTVDFTPDFNLGFEIDDSRLAEFHATATGTLDLDFDIRGEFDGEVNTNNDNGPIELAKFSHTVTQLIGWVPVVEVITLTFEAGYSINVGYNGYLQAGFDSQTGLEFGVEFDGNNWERVFNPSYNFSTHALDRVAESHAYLRGYIRPVLSVELYGIAGPWIDVEPFAKYDHLVELSYWSYDFVAGVESTTGIHVHIFDNTLVDLNMELLDPPYELTLLSDEGGQLNNDPQITSLIATPYTVLPGGTSSIICSATDEDEDVLNYLWTHAGGSISGTGSTITFSAPGVEGVYPITCEVTDGNGGSDSRTVYVIVSIGNQAPTASFTVSPSSGPVETIFSFDASDCSDWEDDSNQLQVRWDWESDGTWDTGYTTTKHATHQFTSASTYTVTLGVKDSGGLIATSQEIIIVTGPGSTGTVTDIDGNVYQTIIIGTQEWMTENLKVTHYQNSMPITHLPDYGAWSNTSSGAYCYNNNDESNANTYGALYNWYAVDDNRNIAPEGWHVPTDAEWKELEMYLGMSQSDADGYHDRGTNEGSKLAGGSGLWIDGELENDEEFGTSGFTALPSGYRHGGIGYEVYFWSAAEDGNQDSYYRGLDYSSSAIYRLYYDKNAGFAVRCVKD